MKKKTALGKYYLVSACLVGIKSRYNGLHAANPLAVKLFKTGKAIPLCPEQLGGQPTPREPAQIERGEGAHVIEGSSKVIDRKGIDRTAAFLRGAQETGNLASLLKPAGVVLKDGSPSCGVTYIYRKGRKVRGMGVTAAWLHKQGVPLYIINEGGKLECIRPKK